MNNRRGNNKQQKQTKSKRKPRMTLTVLPGNGMPPSIVNKFRYCDLVGISNAAAYAQYTFRGNSLFDPDYTGTGHQPRYYDQFSAFYSRYKVTHCSLKLSVSNYSTTSACIVTVIPHSDILTLTNYYDAAEQPLVKRTEQVPISTRQGSRSSVTHSVSTRKVLGLSNAQLAGEDYSASTGATPLSVWYWNIGVFNPQGGNVNVIVDVELEYTALLYDRLNPGAS